MKSVKPFILALVAACALISVTGVGMASATGLCSAEEEECAGENIYPSETAISAQLVSETEATFETNLGTLTCGNSTLAGETLDVWDEPLDGEVTALTFGECKTGLGNCTVEAKNLPYAAGLEGVGSGDGLITTESGGTGVPALQVICGFLVNCTLSASQVSFDAEGGNPATLEPNPVEFEAAGSACPTEVVWTAEYEVTQPKPAFVQKKLAATALCNKKESPCKEPEKNRYPSGTVLEASSTGESQFAYQLNGVNETVKCLTSVHKLKTSADKGMPLLGQMTELGFFVCKGGGCTVKALFTPYNVKMFADPMVLGYGEFSIESGGGGPPTIEIKCTATCFYRAEGKEETLMGQGFEGLAEPLVVLRGKFTLLNEGAHKSDAKCGPSMLWGNSFYVVTKPSNVYMIYE